MKRHGFTLIEILVAVAIIVVLIAIIFAGLTSGKRSAKNTVGISQLRQLGQAAAIYFEDSNVWPVSARQLVDARLAPKALLENPNDSTNVGLGNTAILSGYDGIRAPEPTAYKNSYGGFLEWEISPIIGARIFEAQGGWLVDLSPSQRTGDPRSLLFSEGAYQRLQFDTAVVLRRHFNFVKRGGPVRGNYRSAGMLFVDDFDEISKDYEK